MIIETSRLRLRPFKMEDANWHFIITKDRAVQKYLPEVYPRTLQESKNTIKRYCLTVDFIDNFYFVIEDKKTQECVGFLDIDSGLEGMLAVTMVIASGHRGKGYIVEAVKGCAQSIPNRNFRFCVRKKNKASLKAVQKLDGIIELKSMLKAHRIFVLKT